MKKAGVLTFHDYDNYGAILQSYALQIKLKELGWDAEIIDYSCAYIHHPFSFRRLKEKGILNYIYGAVGYICYLPRRKKCNQFRKHMKYSARTSRAELPNTVRDYDAVVVGSDQLWDYQLTGNDTTYYLDFDTGDARKICYAVSTGEHLPPDESLPQIRNWISDFDDILVREQYGAEFIETLTGVQPNCVCDPTLLLTGEEWAELSVTPPVKKDYILVYQLGINPDLVVFVKRLQKETGLKVVYIPFPLVGLMRCRCNIALGPEKWIGYFRQASYVVTDSFHGVAFSVLMRRPFFTIVAGHHKNRRVDEFLEKLDLKDRAIDASLKDRDAVKKLLQQSIDYSETMKRMDLYREESLQELKRCLISGNERIV